MVKVISAEIKVAILKAFRHYKQDRPDLLNEEITTRLVDIFMVSARTIRSLVTKRQDCLKSICAKRNRTDVYLNYIFRKELQHLIWNYHLKNEYFTLDKILTDSREYLDYKGGSTNLFKIIKSMGYKHKKVDGRKLLCEQKHVVAAKIIFLSKFLQYQNSNENVTFVYLDETWIYQNGSRVPLRVNELDIKSNPTKIKCEGKRFTILNAGSNLGFLEGCDMLLDSLNNDRDYHKSMNGEIFQNWVVNQLIPALDKLQGKCVVVMDNAPYHSVQLDKPPTFSSKKSKMEQWLLKYNVNIPGKITKKQLWELVKPFRKRK